MGSEVRTPLLDAGGNPYDDGTSALTAYGFSTPAPAERPASGGRGESAAPAPGPRSSSGGAGPLWTVCPFILANEFCERLAYYGLATNLVTYLGTDPKHGVMQLDSDAASAAASAWAGTCYLTAIIGAVVADAALGRYRTIVLFCTIYAVGFSLLTCSAGLIPSWAPKNHEKPTQSQTASLFIALYIIALGTGGIKPNVSSFGADQFDVTDPVALKQKESFFNYFYLVINCGSLIASIAIVQVQNSSWKIGFLIPTIAMIVSVLCFVAGSSRYRHSPRPTGGSPITRALRIMWLGGCESWRSRRKGYVPPLAAVPVREEGGLIGAKASAVAIPAWLQLATHEKGGRFSSDQAEEVALIVRLVPIMLTGIIFWAVYAQMSTAFVQQGGLMDCRLGSFVISQASLSSFDTISIILLIPIFDKLLYPRLRRAGFRVSNLQRTGAGYIFAVFAMLAAAAVEKGRQAAFSNGNVFPAPPAPSPLFLAPPSPGRHLLEDAYPPPQIVRISVFAQIPQYMLVGTAEVLAAVAQLDWFYSEAPATMRSMGMALQLLSVALGQYLASALTILISGLTRATGRNWYPKDLNTGRLDLFFLLLAVLMLLDFFAFWFCARRFVSVSGDAEAGAGAATLDSVAGATPGGATPDQFSSPAVPPSTGGASNPFSTPGKGGEW